MVSKDITLIISTSGKDTDEISVLGFVVHLLEVNTILSNNTHTFTENVSKLQMRGPHGVVLLFVIPRIVDICTVLNIAVLDRSILIPVVVQSGIRSCIVLMMLRLDSEALRTLRIDLISWKEDMDIFITSNRFTTALRSNLLLL